MSRLCGSAPFWPARCGERPARPDRVAGWRNHQGLRSLRAALRGGAGGEDGARRFPDRAGRRRHRRPHRLRRRDLRRGIDFVQIPTTLLPRSIPGGRQDRHQFPQGKNLIGAFHQPGWCWPTPTSGHLAAARVAAGYAEVIKYGLIDDAGFLRLAGRELAGGVGTRPRLSHAIAVSCDPRPPSLRRRDRTGRPRPAQSRPHLRPRPGEARRLDSDASSTARRSRSAWPAPSVVRPRAGLAAGRRARRSASARRRPAEPHPRHRRLERFAEESSKR